LFSKETLKVSLVCLKSANQAGTQMSNSSLTAETLPTYRLESGMWLSEFRFFGSASFNIQSTIIKKESEKRGGLREWFCHLAVEAGSGEIIRSHHPDRA